MAKITRDAAAGELPPDPTAASVPPAPIPETTAAVPPAPVGDQAAASAAASFADGHVDPLPAYARDPIQLTAMRDGIAAMPAEMRASLLAELQAHERQVTLTQGEVTTLPASEGHILIVCHQPGFRRAGVRHPAREQYPLDHFTHDQLVLLTSEPKLEIVAVGGAIVARPAAPAPVARTRKLDALMAGQAAADAISRPPNREEPGLRNALAGAPATHTA